MGRGWGAFEAWMGCWVRCGTVRWCGVRSLRALAIGTGTCFIRSQAFWSVFSWVRPRVSVWACVRPCVRPSIRWSVRRSVVLCGAFLVLLWGMRGGPRWPGLVAALGLFVLFGGIGVRRCLVSWFPVFLFFFFFSAFSLLFLWRPD